MVNIDALNEAYRIMQAQMDERVYKTVVVGSDGSDVSIDVDLGTSNDPYKNAYIENLVADAGSITTLSSTTSNITNATINTLNSTTSTISNLTATTGTVSTLTSTTTSITGTATIATANITTGTINTATITNASITTASVSGTATIGTANITTGTINTLTSTSSITTTASITGTATIGTANITTATISDATVTNLSATLLSGNYNITFTTEPAYLLTTTAASDGSSPIYKTAGCYTAGGTYVYVNGGFCVQDTNNSLTVGTLTLDGITITGSSSAYTVTVASYLTADRVYNAVWNDIADAITVDQEDKFEPGYAYAFDGGKWFKTEGKDSPYFGIHSDTAGYVLGMDPEKNQIMLAVGGFVLAYVDKEYPAGTKLTYGKGGILTKAKRKDEVVAKFFKPEPETSYHGIEVNNRFWVKVL